MSSNNPLIQKKEYTVKDMIFNFKTDQQKGSHTEFENPISKNTEKDMALNKLTLLYKSSYSSRTPTEYTVTPETKTISISSASLDEIDLVLFCGFTVSSVSVLE